MQGGIAPCFLFFIIPLLVTGHKAFAGRQAISTYPQLPKKK